MSPGDELSAERAVYFAINKKMALFYSAFEAGLASELPLTKLQGIALQTPFPPCLCALIEKEYRELFVELNTNLRMT